MTEDGGQGKPLASKVSSGTAWLFGSYALNRLGRVAMMLVVAALLSPREYGLIGLSAVIITTAQIINEFGIWQAVVHRKDPDERFVDTAFVANVFCGLVLTAVVFLVAPWLARFYGEPEMTGLLRIMGLSLVFGAIYYVPDGLLRKGLEFKSRALPEVAGIFGFAVSTVALLLLGFGVSSYGVGLVVESVVRCALTFRGVGWRPRLRVSPRYLKDIAIYARHILGADLARHLSSNVDYLVVGRILGAGPLGFYTLAFNLANYPVSNFAYVLSRIAFPTFAALQDDPDYARRVYLKMVRAVAALAIPALVVLALLASPLTVGLLGEKWKPAILALQIMAAAGVSRAISFPGSDMLRALGFQRMVFRINVLESMAMLVALLLVAARGIEAVALTVTLVMVSTSWTVTIATCRAFEMKVGALVRALAPGVALAASGALPILFLGALGAGVLPELVELAVSGVAAFAAMGVCLATACRGLLQEAVAFVASRRPKQVSSPE